VAGPAKRRRLDPRRIVEREPARTGRPRESVSAFGNEPGCSCPSSRPCEHGALTRRTPDCSYHERSRTHLSVDKDMPIPRPVTPPPDGAVVAIPKSVASIIAANDARPERASRRRLKHSSVVNRLPTHSLLDTATH
jgi:hypothetical protein